MVPDGFSDEDMAGDIDNGKSLFGTLFFFGNCPISWQWLKQKVVSPLSSESTSPQPPRHAKASGWTHAG
jgi:hypothetical protein